MTDQKTGKITCGQSVKAAMKLVMVVLLGTVVLASGAVSVSDESQGKQIITVTAVTHDSNQLSRLHNHLFRTWAGSHCSTLIDGERFTAEIEKTTMWIRGRQGGNQGKEVRV